MDTFFNIMNIRDVNSHKFDLKPSLIPFSSINDPRFSWLRNVFLQYLDDWLHSIEHREGNFSRNAKNRMFISQQTYEGLTLLAPGETGQGVQCTTGVYFCRELLNSK